MHRRFVLARDLPVFREQGLPNILYFSDDRPEALAREVTRLVEVSNSDAPAAELQTWAGCVDGLLETLGLSKIGARCRRSRCCGLHRDVRLLRTEF